MSEQQPVRDPEHTLTTYRFLRLGVPAIIVMLALSVLLQWMADEASCWQTSISAYYFTPARGVFVGTLCALGACFIVYRGNTPFEDVALNFAGVMACVVAFVPTERDTTCDLTTFSQPEGPLPVDGTTLADGTADILAGIRNNFLSLVIGLLIVQIVLFFLPRTVGSATKKKLALAGVVQTLVLVAVVIWYSNWPDSIVRYGHAISASVLVLGITAVMINNSIDAATKYANDDSPRQPGEARPSVPVIVRSSEYYGRYAQIAGTMIVTVVAIVIAHFLIDGWKHWLLVLEVLVFLEFTVFWGIQTKELWNVRTRDERVAGLR